MDDEVDDGRDDVEPSTEARAEPEPRPAIGPRTESIVVTGYVLRCCLVLVLREAHGPMSIPEMVAALSRRHCVTRTRASKDVSDALRWEVARGRVRHVARGRYAVGRLPRQTAWRMRRRLAELGVG